jgi:hypothetical protein
MIEKLAEVNSTEERKASRSKATKDFWADPENWNRMSDRISAARGTEDARLAQSERTKEYWKDPEYRKKVVDSIIERANDPLTKEWMSELFLEMHREDPEWSRQCTMNMLNAQYRQPSSLEKKVIDLGIDNLEYTGWGHQRYWTTIFMDGKPVRKNPDFISLAHTNKKGRTTKVVEVIGARTWTRRDHAYDAKLVAAYAEAGIDCLIIGEEEFGDMASIEARLESFVNNHYLTVEFVRSYDNPSVIGDYKYDLEVEGNHNYFVGAGNVDMPTRFSGHKIPVLVHNCSRLIRTETVWTPGVLEQGNARIGRPNIKNAETRSEILYDWVISNKTIDVTKISYLMAKTISRAKYEEAGNEPFDKLEVPPLFPMTLDAIMDSNDFDSTMLDYYGKYEAYKQAMFEEYRKFREENRSYLFNSSGQIRMTPATRSENLPGSKLIVRVPYVPGMELYKSEDLGVVRYDAYMRLADEEEDASDQDDGDDEKEDLDNEADPSSALAEERARAIGLGVHTDRGDGLIVGVGKRNIQVELSSGEKFTMRKMAAFIITRQTTSNKDIRTQLLKMSGDVPLDTPVESLESQLTPAKLKRMERIQRKITRQTERQLRTEEREARKNRLFQERNAPVVEEEEAPAYKIRPAYSKPDRRGNQTKFYQVFDQDGEVAATFDTRKEAVVWVNEQTNPVEEEPEVSYIVKPAYTKPDRRGNRTKFYQAIDQDGNVAGDFDTRKEALNWVEEQMNPSEDVEEDVEEETEEVSSAIPMNLEFTVVNDILGMRLVNIDNEESVDLAQTYGFKFSPEYYAAEIPTAAHLLRLFKRWEEEGYTVPKENSAQCFDLYTRLKTGGKKNAPNVFGFATSLQLKNFYRQEFKPNPKTDVLLPYPIVQDDVVYIALPKRAHPASLRAITNVRVPGIKWMAFDAGSELILFTTTKPEASRIIRKMIDNGVDIENIDEMRKKFKALRLGREPK